MTDASPFVAAQNMVNSHVVKMILESCQILSTAHRYLDGKERTEKTQAGRNVKRWTLDSNLENVLYSATHVNHPSCVWVRQSTENYNWLSLHLLSLIQEYTYRYQKEHKSNTVAIALHSNFPKNLKIGDQTPIICAMPDEYKISIDPIENYREYYRKGKIHLHKWINREPPDWLNNDSKK